MHNCKTTRSSLTDLAMDEVQPLLKKQLLAELNECPACHEEYAGIRNVLRASSQALRSTAPAEEFWSGYHNRLVNRIENHSPAVGQPQLFWVSALWREMRTVVTASVRVPVPVAAAAVVLLLGVSTFVSTFIVWQSRQRIATPVQTTSVITKIVEVPIVQERVREKVVTRVVYVEKYRNRTQNVPGQLNVAQSANSATGLAQTAADASVTPALSLVGFKPTDQVKLKVMKGSYRDEQ